MAAVLTRTRQVLTGPRARVAARILAAVFGGYALTATITGLMARHLALAPAEAVIAATLTSFVVFPGIVMTVFSVRSLPRLLAWMAGAGLVLGGALWLSLAMWGRL